MSSILARSNRFRNYLRLRWLGFAFLAALAVSTARGATTGQVVFNRDVRRILSENCLRCHGFDPKERKGGKDGLRLDTFEGATADTGGKRAIVPGSAERSEVYRRIVTSDEDDVMPPPKSGKKLTPKEIDTLKRWIQEGASYSQHWAYVRPVRPSLPKVSDESWTRNGLDYFVLARLDQEHLKPSPEADRYALIRRVSLDLTGLPPSIEEVDAFVADVRPGAYERLVERLLNKSAFGEHWARMWLDHARYADSSGYADDPGRTIWAFRDYVIRSLNANKPFDRFTMEQLAGDLMPGASDEQMVATAFHRNTMTNNEGGTNDEEFRNVAVVDRVNTTLAVWMGTTIACAQCHDHKYDPISQEEYFKLFALFNSTEDADRPDESPVLAVFSDEQKRKRSEWESEIRRLERVMSTSTPELVEARHSWERLFTAEFAWTGLKPAHATSREGAQLTVGATGEVRAERKAKTDSYTLRIPIPSEQNLTALRLETVPDATLPKGGAGFAEGSFVLSRVSARVIPPEAAKVTGRYVRVEIPGREKILSLAEVEVFSGGVNVATSGEAKQSSTGFGGPAKLAIDGNTNGNYEGAKSTTHTEISTDPWWELDLKMDKAVERLVIWNRTDSGTKERLSQFKISLLGAKREVIWTETVATHPDPSRAFVPDGSRELRFGTAFADYTQQGYEASSVLRTGDKDRKGQGWAVGGQVDRPHALNLVMDSAFKASAGSILEVVLVQDSKIDYATLAGFRVALTEDPRMEGLARLPAALLPVLRKPEPQRTTAEQSEVTRFYPTIAPALAGVRGQLDGLRKQLGELKPVTTVPVMRQLAGEKQRKTHVQRRGNFMDLGQEVSGGVPGVFPSSRGGASDRLGLARWLMSPENPLTARVVVNHFWESIFGMGLVRTSEEFGAQGEPPSHPELLDWMATELMSSEWNIKHLLKLMVTSSAYRQSSRVSEALAARDPENRLLARGPRFRLSAETIRDQAMSVAGLLSGKMYGMPVKPAQPKQGLSAAFGSGIDWETSPGEDRYRRALYTTWRRSNPYPSMATFDAPNREVCTVRRERSNTPLQALVTLNDPVYVEAAKALARRILRHNAKPEDRLRFGFRLCVSRPPTQQEAEGLLALQRRAMERYRGAPEKARSLVSASGLMAPEGDATELASWTVVANVLLNLDEVLMKR